MVVFTAHEKVRRSIGKTVAEGNGYDLLTGYKTVIMYFYLIQSRTLVKDTKT